MSSKRKIRTGPIVGVPTKITKEESRRSMIMHLKDVEINHEQINITWNDLEFGKNCIKFKVSNLKKIIQPYSYDGLIESLNLVKEDYFSKFSFKIAIYKGSIVPQYSKGLKNLLSKIEIVKEFYSFKRPSAKSKFGDFIAMSNTDILELFHSSINKSEYVKYLAKKQRDNSINIIPIVEFSNNRSEEAFLFRFPTRNNSILLIWESTLDGRASHLFEYDVSEEKKVLTEIKHFVGRDDLMNKRSGLHSNSMHTSQTKSVLGYKGHINHTTLTDYIKELENII